MPRELHLLAFGNTRSAGPWRHPEIDNSPAGVRRRLAARAQTAEAGGFDAVFFADGLNYGPAATWAYKTTEDFEPLTTTAALSSVTESIGLVVTGSATLVPPFQLARQLLSLDHLSGGRAGWNLVTSFAAAAADNFSAHGVVDHDERYRIAEEALDVVKKLWDGWADDTIVEDRVVGIFNDVNKIRVADHHGRYFDVRGPIGSARSPQGQPVLFQAGSSPTGRRFAAHHAEVIFRSGHPLAGTGVLPADPRRVPQRRAADPAAHHALAAVHRRVDRRRGTAQRTQRIRILQPRVPGRLVAGSRRRCHRGRPGRAGPRVGVSRQHPDPPDRAGRLPRAGRRWSPHGTRVLVPHG